MTSKNQNLPMYYAALTEKYPFLRKVASKCDTSIATVQRWCYGDGKTKNPLYLQALSEETGIAIKNLFNRNLNHE